MSALYNEKKTRILMLIISITITIVIISCGLIYFFYSRNNIINEEYSTLESIGKWKLQQIIDWREDKKNTTEILLSEDIVTHINEIINKQNESEAREHIMNRLQTIQDLEEIHFSSILDKNFEPILKTYSFTEPLSVATKNALISSQTAKAPIVSDFFKSIDGDIHIDIVSAVTNSSNEISAYIVLSVNVEDYLFPLVQTWPLQSETSENLLFKIDGSDILFLNELRHTENTALEFKIPLTNKDLPAVQFAEGKKGIIIGNDYRNIQTIVYGSTVPETNWYLLSKVDYSEAFSDLRSQLAYIALIIALLLLITPFIVMYIIKKHDFNISQKLYESEVEKSKTNALLRVIINNLPQRIFWKDVDLNYLGCNAQFAKDCGFKNEDDIIGISDYDIVGKAEAEEYRQIDRKILLSLKPKSNYIDDGTIQGREVWFRKSKIPIIDKDQNVIGLVCTSEDITEQKETEEELTRHTNFLHAIYENINGLLFSFDSNGTILFIEGKLLSQLNINSVECIDSPFIDIFKYEEVEKAVIKSLNGQSVTVNEFEVFNTVLNIFFQPTLGVNGEVLAVYGIAVDVSDLHIAIQNLERSNKELEQFAYIASHDLQEPLRMVSNFTQLLEQKYSDKLDERANKYIFYAVDGAKRMQTLINDLLNYSRINTREKEHSLVDMSKILEQVKHNLSTVIIESNAKIECDGLPIITAEPTQMYQIMQNLISNALKFKNIENPVIIVKYKENTTSWQFEVKDNGIGIEEKYKEKIFLIFQRLHSRSEYSGTGIGLALCKRITSKHGGNIWFESTKGEGTSFYFTISKLKKENKTNDAD